jgi:hypothetical protein
MFKGITVIEGNLLDFSFILLEKNLNTYKSLFVNFFSAIRFLEMDPHDNSANYVWRFIVMTFTLISFYGFQSLVTVNTRA